MKKVIVGTIMFYSGILSTAILYAAAITHDWTVNGQHSVLWNLLQGGLEPILHSFAVIAFIGFVIAIWGIFEKNANEGEE